MKSTHQKTHNLNVWMLWKTSKEYTIHYLSNDKYSELALQPTMGKIVTKDNGTFINKKQIYLVDGSFSNKKLEYNACHDIACGIDYDKKCHIIYHYRIFNNKQGDPVKLLIQPLIELPELGDIKAWGFNANEEGTMIGIVLPGGTIATIIPKKIPAKNLLTFNNLHDINLDYLCIKNVF